MKKVYSIFAAVLLAMGLLACDPAEQQNSSVAQSAQTTAKDTSTLNCIAGSELENVGPLLGQLKRQTGITLNLVSSGTLSSVETLEAGNHGFDCGWFSHNKYLMLNEAVRKQVKASERIMMSPVILGVKTKKANSLGWTSDGTTWADVAKASKEGKFRFAMTSPSSSNTGMSALIGVTAAMSGSDAALDDKAIQKVEISGFGRGQVLFADSSGWLMKAFVQSLQDPEGPDGIINYESELLRVNKENNANLTLIYPKEGIITADYPLMLLNGAKKAQFDKVVEFLKQNASQEWLSKYTYRRPSATNTGVDMGQFGDHLLVEVAFPAKMEVLDALLTSYQDKQRKPAHVYFVLDTSGSMGGNGGIVQLRKALHNLTGADTSVTGRYARFRQREIITVVEFASGIKSEKTFDLGTTREQMNTELKRFSAYVDSLDADGGTAMFDGVSRAYQLALNNSANEPDYLQSVVVMTDGLTNEGMSANDFVNAYDKLPPKAKNIRIFGVLFGKANKDQMAILTDRSGGAIFDGSQSISVVFKKIRGYQ